MTLEESLKALKSAFTSKSGEAEAMAKEMSELKSKNDTLAAEYAAVTEKLEASAAVIADRDAAIAKVEELTKALAASESLKAEAAKQIESVGKVAAKIVASVGVSPVEISAADSAIQKTPEEIWTEYCAMKDPAKKQAFYNANRAAIVSHLGIK
jgi:chromosome segregation ATPase